MRFRKSPKLTSAASYARLVAQVDSELSDHLQIGDALSTDDGAAAP